MFLTTTTTTTKAATCFIIIIVSLTSTMVPSPTSNDGGGGGGGGRGTAAVAVEGFTPPPTTTNISKKEEGGGITNINSNKNEDHDEEEDNQQQNQNKKTKHHNHNHPLSQIYLNIRKSACCETTTSYSSWPDSTKFCSHLNFSIDKNKYIEPNFCIDGDGPIGVYAMLYENDHSLTILDKCREVYNKFVIEFKEIILQQQHDANNNHYDVEEQKQIIDNFIMNIEKQTYHICISMFQEHPSLIDDEDVVNNNEHTNNWKLIDYETRQKLIVELSNYHKTNIHEPPKLLLDSILFTKDGAMIAGFIDISTSQSFDMLRLSSTNIGRNILEGKLTSRPKNLIHVTIGRILGIPKLLRNNKSSSTTTTSSSSSDDEQQQQQQQQQHQSKIEAAVNDLMVQYNEKIFPNMVESMERKEFILDNVSLVRTNVWPNRELEEFQAWPTSSSSSSSSKSSYSSKSYPVILK